MKKAFGVNSNRLPIFAGFLLLATSNLFAGDIKVIANPSVRAESITSAEIKRVFLLERRTLKSGSPVTPVLLKSGATHQAFLQQYLDRSDDEVRTYYQGLVFTGKGSIPKQFSTDAEVVAYVARTPGAIGYVGSSAATEGVQVVSVGPQGVRQERTLLNRVEPEYPQALQERQIGGTVRLELTISPNGSVENVVTLGGNPILVEAATKAASQWVYAPAASRTKSQVSISFVARP